MSCPSLATPAAAVVAGPSICMQSAGAAPAAPARPHHLHCCCCVHLPTAYHHCCCGLPAAQHRLLLCRQPCVWAAVRDAWRLRRTLFARVMHAGMWELATAAVIGGILGILYGARCGRPTSTCNSWQLSVAEPHRLGQRSWAAEQALAAGRRLLTVSSRRPGPTCCGACTGPAERVVLGCRAGGLCAVPHPGAAGRAGPPASVHSQRLAAPERLHRRQRDQRRERHCRLLWAAGAPSLACACACGVPVPCGTVLHRRCRLLAALRCSARAPGMCLEAAVLARSATASAGASRRSSGRSGRPSQSTWSPSAPTWVRCALLCCRPPAGQRSHAELAAELSCGWASRHVCIQLRHAGHATLASARAAAPCRPCKQGAHHHQCSRCHGTARPQLAPRRPPDAAGWLLFMVFAGVGLVALPLDMLREFWGRPKSTIPKSEYIKRARGLGVRANGIKARPAPARAQASGLPAGRRLCMHAPKFSSTGPSLCMGGAVVQTGREVHGPTSQLGDAAEPGSSQHAQALPTWGGPVQGTAQAAGGAPSRGLALRCAGAGGEAAARGPGERARPAVAQRLHQAQCAAGRAGGRPRCPGAGPPPGAHGCRHPAGLALSCTPVAGTLFLLAAGRPCLQPCPACMEACRARRLCACRLHGACLPRWGTRAPAPACVRRRARMRTTSGPSR